MRTRVITTGVALAVGAITLAAMVGPAQAEDGGRPFGTTLTGAAEVPGPGDPDGSGAATLRLNQGQGRVCYDYSVVNVAPLTAAHIHAAPAGVAGPIVVPLPPTRPDGGSGCASADPELIKAIRQHPELYYVNVHNADFPAGALRGQLG